jgi:hypothetical protein
VVHTRKESKARKELINIRNQLRKPGLEKHTKLELLKREGELEELLIKEHKLDYYDGRLCKHCGKPITGIKHGNTRLHEHCKEPYRQEKEIEYKRTYRRKYKAVQYMQRKIRSKRTIGEHMNPDFDEEMKIVRRELYRTVGKIGN